MISETLIDNIYTNIQNDSMKAGIINSDISDHYLIFSCFKLYFNNKYTTFNQICLINNDSISSLCNYIIHFDSSYIDNINTDLNNVVDIC